jgi:hypothetical protein
MATNYSTWQPDQNELYKEFEQADEFFRLKNQTTPRWADGEPVHHYRRRLTERMQSGAPNCQGFNLAEATGSAAEVLINQVREDALKEARHPTQVPDGELKEVTRYDAAGRPFKEFYGRPSVWLNQFADDRRKMVTNFRTETERGYTNPNVEGIAGLKY